MERKEAIEVIKKNWPDGSFTMLREALETLIPELKESEDERIRKALIKHFSQVGSLYNILYQDILAWLEKQGEHANFCNKIQIGDKVTRNKDGVLVNLSQLNRVAKKDEKQGKQKPAWSDWSEEDEYQINTILHGLDLKRELYKKEGNKVEEDRYNTQYNWLKSLKDRYTWKPSDEQINTLLDAIVYVEGCDSNFKGSGSVLESLYNDLKKLK